jgi:SPP1 gp7 family putative phage head morphogenesis protein
MPDPVDLAYAVRLRPDEAIEYFKSKGYVINWNWFDVAEEVKAKSFWVSKAMRQDILQDFRDAMTEVLEEGLTEREFIKRLKPRLQAKGWWGKQTIVDEFGDEREVQLGSPQRLRTIYRTNKFSAYQCGRLQRHQARSASRPYWQYVAVMDSRTRPSHAALNGVVYRADDPIWRSIYPPNGFNCRCRVRALSQFRLEEEGLTVASSAGQAETRDLQLVDKRTGEITFKPVTSVTAPDGRVFQTDPGFNSAPCDAAFDVRGGLPDGRPGANSAQTQNVAIAGLPGYKDFGLSPARSWPDRVKIPAPQLIETSDSFEARASALADAILRGSAVRWVDSPGGLDPVPITRGSLNHIAGDGRKPDIQRTRFANFIVPTLEAPIEIWDVPFQDGTVRRRYIALFSFAETDRGGIGIVRINRDGSLLWTWFNRRLNQIDALREGTLRFNRLGQDG